MSEQDNLSEITGQIIFFCCFFSNQESIIVTDYGFSYLSNGIWGKHLNNH